MRKLFITLALFLTMLSVSSCATDGVVVYREYPSRYYYYYPYYSYGYYGPTYYTYHYPYYHHHHHGYYHKPPKPPVHPNNPPKPPTPNKPPKATVRPNHSGTVGSMSGGSRPSGNGGGVSQTSRSGNCSRTNSGRR